MKKKMSAHPKIKNLSGQLHWFYRLDKSTLYASPYIVSNEKGYTKHYYAESERIASKIGGGGLTDLASNTAHHRVNGAWDSAMEQVRSGHRLLPSLPSDLLAGLYDWQDSVQPETACYFYHPDHLGSSSWITFTDGEAVQHLHYLPYGEDLVNQQHTVVGAMYTFSAKEKDVETGYSYFGSRYYNSDLSIWLSVDPMSDKYPSLSPYVFCADNPVRVVDPNGEEIDDDIVFHGKNNSSITIKTSLVDLEFNANVDFGGNFTLNLENGAIGFQTEFVATGQAGIGTSYSGFKSKIMFLGGDYAGYCFTQGYQECLSPTVGSGFGHARLTTTSVPTKQRTIGDRIKNLLSH